MPKPKNNLQLGMSISKLKEIYRDHPSMHHVDLLVDQLKQEKLQDKIYCQLIKETKQTH